MKTLSLSIFCSLLAATSFAQAPQGLNFEAVVLGANNAPLSKHHISLQLSILDSVANGTIVYQETQNPTTDSLGLFSVVIGTGTVTAGNFLTINWGHGAKFLKTEIDTSGGSSYVLMGVTQFMSVPYALYANQTKPTYQSLEYPDGLNNLTTVMLNPSSYTVPSGKNLYITPYSGVAVDGDSLSGSSYGNLKPATLGINEGQVVQSLSDTMPGWLVDKSVDWITTDIISSPIKVPNGKIFIIIFSSYSIGNGLNASTYIDGVSVFQMINGFILGPGQTLSATLNSGSGKFLINGYFRNQ
jgi:hypothetical protein